MLTLDKIGRRNHFPSPMTPPLSPLLGSTMLPTPLDLAEICNKLPDLTDPDTMIANDLDVAETALESRLDQLITTKPEILEALSSDSSSSMTVNHSRMLELGVDEPLMPASFALEPQPLDLSNAARDIPIEGIEGKIQSSSDGVQGLDRNEEQMLAELQIQAVQVQRRVEQEQLSADGAKARVPVPPMDFTPPQLPYRSFRGCHPLKLVINQQHLMLKLSDFGQSIHAETALQAIPFRTSKVAKVPDDDTLQGDFDAILPSMHLEGSTITSDAFVWKVDGFAVLNTAYDSDEDDLEEIPGSLTNEFSKPQPLVRKRHVEQLDSQSSPSRAQDSRPQVPTKPVANPARVFQEAVRQPRHQASHRVSANMLEEALGIHAAMYSSPSKKQKTSQSPYFGSQDTLPAGSLGKSVTGLLKWDLKSEGSPFISSLELLRRNQHQPSRLPTPDIEGQKPNTEVIANSTTLAPVPAVPLTTFPPQQDGGRTPLRVIISANMSSMFIRDVERELQRTDVIFPRQCQGQPHAKQGVKDSALVVDRDFSLGRAGVPPSLKYLVTARQQELLADHEPDVTVSPGTGIVFTSLIEVRQRALPPPAHGEAGQPMEVRTQRLPPRERVRLVAKRCERLVVLVSQSAVPTSDSTFRAVDREPVAPPLSPRMDDRFPIEENQRNIEGPGGKAIRDKDSYILPLSEPDAKAYAEFTVLVATALEGTPAECHLVGGGPRALARWVAALASREAGRHVTAATGSGAAEGAPTAAMPRSGDGGADGRYLMGSETDWELFLRCAGFNSFAAQAVVAEMKRLVGDESVDGPQTGSVMARFVRMPHQERVQALQGVLGGRRMLDRVGRLLDVSWS